MKVLYVVYAEDNKYVDFHAVQITEEKENEYVVLDKIKIEEYVHTFPKDKINFEFDYGFVTEKLDKELIKKQIDRIYIKLKEMHLKNEDERSLNINEKYYNGNINLLEKCVTPEEYERLGLKERDEKEMLKKVEVFFN